MYLLLSIMWMILLNHWVESYILGMINIRWVITISVLDYQEISISFLESAEFI